MKITAQALMSFNKGNLPSFNPAYDKAMGIHSQEEHNFLSRVKQHFHGWLRKRITMENVREYKEIWRI